MPTNYSDTTPAAPAGSAAVKFQKSGTDVSAYVEPFDGSYPGAVPQSESGDQAKFLQGNGVWATPSPTFASQNANKVLAGPTTGADAAPTFRALVQADLPAQPYDMPFFYAGKPGADAILFRMKFRRAVTFPANFSGAGGGDPVASATAETVITLKKGGVSCGTVTIGTDDSYTFASAGGAAVSFAVDDVLDIVGPSSEDATLEGPNFVLVGTR